MRGRTFWKRILIIIKQGSNSSRLWQIQMGQPLDDMRRGVAAQTQDALRSTVNALNTGSSALIDANARSVIIGITPSIQQTELSKASHFNPKPSLPTPPHQQPPTTECKLGEAVENEKTHMTATQTWQLDLRVERSWALTIRESNN